MRRILWRQTSDVVKNVARPSQSHHMAVTVVIHTIVSEWITTGVARIPAGKVTVQHMSSIGDGNRTFYREATP